MVPISRPAESMDPKGALRTLRIIHFAMCGSVFVYGLVAYLMIAYGTLPEGGFASDFPNIHVLRTVIYLLAAGCYVTIRIFKARFLTPDALRGRAISAQYINTWYIIIFGLAEAIAIYGFLLFMIAALLDDFLVLAGISLLIFYWLRPKEDEYHTLLRQPQRV